MKKINYLHKIIKTDILLFKNFGIKVAVLDLARSTFVRGNGKIGKKIEIKKNENIKKILLKKYGYIVDLYEKEDFSKTAQNIEINSPIWIFWWQGLDNAPTIVRKCITNIQKHSKSHPVLIVTKYNYNQYAHIPEYIIEKFEKGYISITHFSDILRMQLIYTHGGIWMDSTLYITDDISDDLYKYSYYTIKHEQYADYHVCKGLWTGFFMAGNKGNIAYKFYRDMFFEYWKHENQLICYLLIDCIIALGYENISTIFDMIENVPINNRKVFELSDILSSPFDKEISESLNKNTKIYKLTYKKHFSDTSNGKLSFYGHIMNS